MIGGNEWEKNNVNRREKKEEEKYHQSQISLASRAEIEKREEEIALHINIVDSKEKETTLLK